MSLKKFWVSPQPSRFFSVRHTQCCFLITYIHYITIKARLSIEAILYIEANHSIAGKPLQVILGMNSDQNICQHFLIELFALQDQCQRKWLMCISVKIHQMYDLSPLDVAITLIKKNLEAWKNRVMMTATDGCDIA